MSFASILKSYRAILFTIIAGYVLILIGLVLVGTRVMHDIKTLESITSDLYQHPFMVNGAAREARHLASLIRIELLTALAVRGQGSHADLSKRIHKYSALMETHLETIEANFLGDKALVRELKQKNIIWQRKRAILISLLEQARYIKAEQFMLAVSGKTYEGVAEKLNRIVEYSSHKAAFFAKKSAQSAALAYKQFERLLFGLMLLTLLAAALATSSVLKLLRRRDLQIHQEQERCRSMFESAPIPLVLMSASGNIIQVNGEVQQHFGYKPNTLMGKPMNQLISDDCMNEFGAYTRACFEAGISATEIGGKELIALTQSGHVFPVEISLRRIEISGEYFVLAAMNNLTERKDMENELIKARIHAEAASKTKSGFLANMSHEIRTPLNAIIGLTHLVLDSRLSEKQRDYLTKVHRSSRALLSVLNDILDYSKIEAGHLQIEQVEFNIETIFQQAADLFTTRIDEKGLEMFFELGLDIPQTLIGDPFRLTQILNNLLSNAIKFTESGEIFVKADIQKRTEETVEVRITVRDSGMGMREETVKNLFNSFTQADSSITRKFGGTGLGLTICKSLATLMGGDISVTSNVGAGSTFTFVAPYAITTSTATITASITAQRISYNPQDIQGMRVLVVDDQETSRMVLQGYLESWEFKVTTAASGQQALAIIEQSETSKTPFDLMILDWKMPGMDGLELARSLESRYKSDQHRPIIMMATGFSMQDMKLEAGTLLLDAMLTKPITPSPLFDTIINIKFGDNTKHNRSPVGTTELRKANRSIRGGHILLVEDNDINQDVACEFLQRAGLSVTIANHGKEAVALFQLEAFDAVLMDIHMPVMDGLEATRQIRQLPQGKDIPIIALSAAAMKQDKQHAIESGMNAHLSKPIDPDALLSMLEKWIEPKERAELAQIEPSIVSADLPDTLKDFDLNSAIQRLGGNQALLARLLLRFAEDYATMPELVADMLEQGEYDKAAQLTHRMAGAAANLGASKLAATARQMEGELRDKCKYNALEKLETELGSAVHEIRENISPTEHHAEHPSPTISDPKATMQALVQLSGKLKECELTTSTELSEIYAQLADLVPQAQLLKLSEQIERYDYSTAVTTIDEILVALKAI